MELEPGEVKCDQCKGTGHPNNNEIDYDQKYVTYPWVCDKCNGAGKLDWIENIVGKQPRVMKDSWTVDFSTTEQLYSSDINPIIDKLGEQIAKDIDKQILEGITNGNKTWGSSM